MREGLREGPPGARGSGTGREERDEVRVNKKEAWMKEGKARVRGRGGLMGRKRRAERRSELN